MLLHGGLSRHFGTADLVGVRLERPAVAIAHDLSVLPLGLHDQGTRPADRSRSGPLAAGEPTCVAAHAQVYILDDIGRTQTSMRPSGPVEDDEPCHAGCPGSTSLPAGPWRL